MTILSGGTMGNVKQLAETAAVLPREAIEAMPWTAFGVGETAHQRVLWQSRGSYGGVLRLRPGGEIAPHVHRRANHHVWILHGEVETLGQRLGPGSYVHIPAGVEHGLKAVGPQSCTLLYLYLREEQPATGPSIEDRAPDVEREASHPGG